MKKKGSLRENMASLLLLQGANYVLPLLTFPYLVRVLGTEGFGINAFAQSFAAYFAVTTDYGFNLSATRSIAVHKHEPAKVARVFSSVLTAKLVLFLLGASVFAVSLILLPRLRSHWVVHCAAFASVLGTTLFPGWLFQGLERMRYVTLVNVASKCAATAAVFVFVRDAADYPLAVAIQSCGVVLAGIWALVIARRSLKVSWTRPSSTEVRAALRDGWHVFVSQASSTLFGNTNVFILGMVAPAAVVGKYAVAEKIVRAAVSLSIPVTGAMFPVASSLFARSRDEALAFLHRAALWGGAAFLLGSVSLFLGADLAVRMITGQPNSQIATWVRIMSALPLTVFIDNIYGTQILLNIGKQREFMRAVLFAGIFSVVTSVIVVPAIGGTGSAVVFTASEMIVLVLMVTFVHRAGIRLRGAGR